MKKQPPIYPIEPWAVTQTAFEVENNYRNETTFALSNGYLGTRGTCFEGYDLDADTGLEGNFINGFYESEQVRYGEWNYGFPTESQSLLNLPDCKRTVITLLGERLDLRVGRTVSYAHSLHMDKGTVTRDFVWESPAGMRTRVHSQQLVCLQRKNLMALSISVTPENWSGEMSFCSILNADVENSTRKTNPLVDYGPFGRCIEPDEVQAGSGQLYYRGTTRHSKLTVSCAVKHVLSSANAASTYETDALKSTAEFSVNASQGSSVIFTKYIAYTSSLDLPPAEQRGFCERLLDQAAAEGLEVLLREQAQTMSAFWQSADVSVQGDDALQQGLRFNLFHIMQAAGRDGRTGMGAKGLSGEGYEGHYFWDTEMYILPVFVWTQPELAKQLLLYRYHTLPQARERAKVLGHPSGALYPWRTINGEEASTYFPLGTAQYHINGDIAYAVWLYYQATGDLDFLRDYGGEMLIETARVYADVGCFAKCRGGKYCICSVTGPDEYNAIVDNNFYTNLLAQENIRAALSALDSLGSDADMLKRKLGVTPEELAYFERVADNMYFPYDEDRGVYLQDDGFLMRKPYDESSIPPERRHLLYENYHPLFIYRQRMSKQADAILALTLYSARFSDDELKRNFDFYQAVTLHHSSLSTCVFGILASRIGYNDIAYRYFSDSARMDLDDYHENFYAGIHAANMAGTWLAVVNGFAGLRMKYGLPEFSPSLPDAWTKYEFCIIYHGARLSVETTRAGAVYTLKSDKPICFLVRGRVVHLNKAGERYYEAL